VDFDGAAFMDRVPVPRPGATRGAGPEGLVLQAPDGAKLVLRERPAAVALRIDGRRSVRACYADGASLMESPQFAVSFCRDLFRQLWLIGYLDLVHETAV
jgi:hypothetical protein